MYFTSGTSGEPKMVAHDFRYPLGHIITAKYWHNLNEDSLHFTLADTGWGKAVWGKYYGQWIVGANVFVYDFEKFKPVDVLKMIEKFRITSFCAPPTVYRFLIREDVSQYDISSLQYCTNAGEALNPNVFDRWYALTGIKLHEAFGQTETTATVGTYPWVEPRPGSMGKANPGYDIDLITADGRVAEEGQQGEIIVRTHGRRPEGLFLGYYRDPELTHQNYHDGIYHTGDIAWRDGKTFTVLAKNNSDKNIYVQRATLNGKPYTKSYISYDEIINGGTLELVMGPKPSKWGTAKADRP